MRRHTKPDLPAEFNLAKYKKCAFWGLKEWADALSMRMEIRKFWRLACLEGKNNKVPDHMMHFVQNTSAKILNNPLDVNVRVNPFSAEQSNKVELSMRGQLPIRDQSPADYFAGAHMFNHPDGYLEWVNRAIFIENEYHSEDDDDHNETLTREEHKFYDTPAWKMHEACSDGEFSIDIHPIFISVDLRASDDNLVIEFKKWLSKTRKDIGITPKNRLFHKDDFADWHAERLLQYLDLTFWAMTHKVNFTNEELGREIFPQGGASESRMRRTLRINALKIISEEYVFALNDQLYR